MVLELEMALFPSAKIDGTKIFYVTYLMFFSRIICTDPVMENASKYWPTILKLMLMDGQNTCHEFQLLHFHII